MRRLILLAALALAGCGGNDEVASAPTPTQTATPTATATATPESTPAAGKCDEVEYTPKDEGGTVHPASNFFEPGATNLPSAAELDHLLIADNALVVIYAADSPKQDIDRFSEWWAQDVKQRTPVVVPDDAEDALPVRARIATVELRCNGIDFEQLTKFANRTDIAPLGGHG